MEDDDLDLELEPIKRPQKPVVAPKPAELSKPAVAAKPAEAAKPGPATKAPPDAADVTPAAASALPARKRSPLARACDAVAGPFRALRLPACNARSAGWGLVGLIVLALLGGNWAPVRINLFGLWYIDPPKPLAFIVDVAIGAVLVLLWQRSGSRRGLEAPASGAKTDSAATAAGK